MDCTCVHVWYIEVGVVCLDAVYGAWRVWLYKINYIFTYIHIFEQVPHKWAF